MAIVMIVPNIDAAFALLGGPQTQTAVVSFDDPYMYRASWRCGCVLNYVDKHIGAFHWQACRKHESSEVEFWQPEYPTKTEDNIAQEHRNEVVEIGYKRTETPKIGQLRIDA